MSYMGHQTQFVQQTWAVDRLPQLETTRGENGKTNSETARSSA